MFKKEKFVLSLTFLFSGFAFSQNAILWQQTWEDPSWIDGWHVDAGTWQVGNPSSGPGDAFEGGQCAATVLDGNYTESVDSRLIRHQAFVVPPASENPRLRFWHWFSFNADDWGRVQIRETGLEQWQDLSEELYTNSSSLVWSYPSLDLSSYSGKPVEIAFYFHSQNRVGSIDVSSGWYIDSVSVITGPVSIDSPETWESGLGDWFSDRGTWQVGVPNSGPNSAFNGFQCAATVLDGNYSESVDSRLRSPYFRIPENAERPNLRFQHWFSFNADDWGKVQIRELGGDWVDLSQTLINTSGGVWSFPFFDLSEFSGKVVEIAFYFHSQNRVGSIDVSSGWYVDDVSISHSISSSAPASITPPRFVTEANVFVTEENQLGIFLPNPNTDGINSDGSLDLSYLLAIEQDCFIELNQEISFPTWPQTIRISRNQIPVDNYLIRLARKGTLANSKDEIISDATIIPGPRLSDVPLPPPENALEFDRWLFHIPRNAGGFSGTIRVNNPNLQDTANVLFVGYHADGDVLFSEIKSIDPGAINQYAIYAEGQSGLFGDDPTAADQVSHVAVWERSDLTQISVRYISNRSGYGVFVDENDLSLGEQSGSEILIEGATPNQDYFDGVAILNLKSDFAAQITVTRIGTDGSQQGEITLGRLEPQMKMLSVLSDAFQPFMADASYLIRSVDDNQAPVPIQVLGLSGLKTGSFLSSIKVTVKR